MDERNWDAVCDTNLKGPFFLTKFALGGTATGPQHRTAAAKQATPQERERASAVTVTSWLYDPADVARTLVLLASDDAATITGASIAIDHATAAGGWASQWVHQMIARPSGTG